MDVSHGELKAGAGKTIECTPIVVDGVMYLTTGGLRVVALDAETGKELWQFDPLKDHPFPHPPASGGVNRGCAYWSDGKPGGARRILHGTSGRAAVLAGRRDGEARPEVRRRRHPGPPQGTRSEGEPPRLRPHVRPGDLGGHDPPGVLLRRRAGHRRPGRYPRVRRPIGRASLAIPHRPRLGEFGNETWEADSWKDRGGANAWGGLSVDATRGLVFAGLGSAAFDFFGGDRKGDNLFANCTIALDARTGRRVWHYQTLRHDLWDHDLPVYPNLVTVTRDGKPVDAVAQVTKTGYVFLFDRATGRPSSRSRTGASPPPTSRASGPRPRSRAGQAPAVRRAGPRRDERHRHRPGQPRIGPGKRLKKIRSGPAFNPPSTARDRS